MKRATFVFIIVCCALSHRLTAATMRLASVGCRIGQVRPAIISENTPSLGLNAQIYAEQSSLLLSPFAEYWALDYQENERHRERQLFAVGLSAQRPFNLNNSKAVPYIAGGAGVTLNFWQIESDTNAPVKRKHEFDLALVGAVGLDMPVSPTLHGLVELKYSLAGVVDYFGFWIGISYQFNDDSRGQ